MGARTVGDYPRTLAEFYRRFPDDEACLRYLVDPMAGFATLLGLGTILAPTPVERILSPLSPSATKRRRGRSTGLTTARFSVQINEAASLQEAQASLNAVLDDLGA